MIRTTLAFSFATLFLSSTPASAALHVVATTTDLASLAREVGGNLVEVEALARGGQDPHRLAATPPMVVRLSRADLFVQNGLDLEIGWAPALLQSARNDRVRPGGAGFVDASHRVTLLEVPSGAVDRSMGDVHPYGNPHYTLDPVRAKRAAWNIANALRRIDSANAALYDRRLVDFYARADSSVARARARFATHRGAPVLGYHRKFTYLIDRLGLRLAETIEPRPGIPPSASHVASLVELVRRERIRVILVEPWNDRGVADRIAEATGARVVVLAPAAGADPAAPDVLSLFEVNARRIAEAFAP